jgi:hypothetical protein
LFYQPKIAKDPNLPANEFGYTTMYGDIFISSKLSPNEAQLTLIHEQVHSFLTPRLQIFRNIRIRISANSYSQSYILRYLEEALAETVSLVRGHGVSGLIGGLTFPVKNGYVTITKMGNEIAGIFMGPINIGGVVYKAIYVEQD